MTRLALQGGDPVRQRPFPAWPPTHASMLPALGQVLDSGHWWQSGGGRAEQFEVWMKDLHSAAGCCAVTNGTHAIELALRALEIGPGDEVLVPALTFISTATAVSFVHARPVPVDVLEDTLCIDVEDAERKIGPRTKAILPVHLAGQPADMDAVLALSARHGLAVVEDVAQGLGAEWRGRITGSMGDMATYSFQAGKLLPAGEGGAVVIPREELVGKADLLMNCGRRRGDAGYAHQLIGSNFRMTEFQAALLLAQVDRLSEFASRRDRAARSLRARLGELGVAPPVPIDPRVTRMAWYMFLIRVPSSLSRSRSSEAFAHALAAEGIPARPMFPPWHSTPAYSDLAVKHRHSCPTADRCARSVVWLHHRLLLDGERGVEDIARAVEKISRALAGKAGSPQGGALG